MTDGKLRFMFSGRIGVEFFFLVSGYLMAASAEKVLKRNSNYNLSKECEKFLLGKFCNLCPTVLLGLSMQIVVASLFNHYSFSQFCKTYRNFLPNFFLLDQTGINITSSVAWYISSMLIAMAILYPLMLRHNNLMKRIGSVLIGSLVLGYLMMNTQNLSVKGDTSNSLLINRNLRAIADLCFGCFSYELVKLLNNLPFTSLGKKVITFAELILYAIALGYMAFIKGSKFDYFIVYVLLAAVTISFSDIPTYRNVFNNQFCYFLGKASLYIYLSHSWFTRDLSPLLGSTCGNKIRMVTYLTLVMLAAAVLWILCILFSRLTTIVKKLFIQESPTASE